MSNLPISPIDLPSLQATCRTAILNYGVCHRIAGTVELWIEFWNRKPKTPSVRIAKEVQDCLELTEGAPPVKVQYTKSTVFDRTSELLVRYSDVDGKPTTMCWTLRFHPDTLRIDTTFACAGHRQYLPMLEALTARLETLPDVVAEFNSHAEALARLSKVCEYTGVSYDGGPATYALGELATPLHYYSLRRARETLKV